MATGCSIRVHENRTTPLLIWEKETTHEERKKQDRNRHRGYDDNRYRKYGSRFKQEHIL
ncbi:hypothetical protein CHS0354_001168, partial [Potamilus streckersoni]